MKGIGRKDPDLSNFGNGAKSVKAKGKRNRTQHHTLVNKFLFHGVGVNNSGTIIHI